MEVEKKRSKGGFFNLFDWNGKSRKKLFSSNSEPTGSQQGKENVENFSQTQLSSRAELDEKGASSSHKGSSDWNCASSLTSDEGGGSRAPGVVARLMGLDSLPATTVNDSSSILSIDSHSLRAPHHDRTNPNLWGDFYAMDYMNMPNKLDRVSWNPVESRAQGVQNRPIERFQTEVLPPKSAKSIPVTHHKLLSPIKTPGFIPTKNAAYIMEAAAKMIEASPRASSKNKISSRSSSIPLRIRDLKEKMEAVPKVSRPERPKEPSDAKCVKGRPGYKSYNGSDNVPVPKASVDSDKQNYNDIRNKGKAASLAVQAKANVQRKEGSPPFSNRSSTNQKEQNEVKQNDLSKSRQSTQRPVHKRTSTVSNKSVLKQNNQKQNCLSNKDRMSSKNVVSNQPTRRMRPTNGSSRQNRTVNKVLVNSDTGSRKMSSTESATGKEFSFSTVKDISGKLRSAGQDFHLEEIVADNGLISRDERPVKCNVAMEGYTNLCTDNRKQDMDVVSFTFTSPLKKSISELQLDGQVVSTSDRFCIDSFSNSDQRYPKHFTFSSPGLNVIGGDALSVLLEQKLQELTCKVESSRHNLFGEGTSASSSSSMQELVSSEVSTTGRGKKFELGLLRDNVDGVADFGSLSANANQKWQGPEGTDECSSSSKNSVPGKDIDYQLDPISVFEPSFESGSCTDNRSSATGSESEKCSFVQAQDKINLFSSFEIEHSYGASELSDSASTWELSGKNMSRVFGFHSPNQSNDWELEYVQYILSKVDLVIEDFALGDTNHVISPNLFDYLQYHEEYPKLQQKLLFDSVNESLHNRCKQIVVGSRKAWDRWETLSPRKESLADELYKEISIWKYMGDLMADDLVEKDMSTQRGRWLDFEIEAFEEGVDIEKGILSSLVDELVSDFLLY